jgi:hypothetical protein
VRNGDSVGAGRLAAAQVRLRVDRFLKTFGNHPKNISNLHQVCTYALPDETTFESSLVEVNGTLYFTSSEYTYAIDAASCARKWRVRHEMEGPGGTVRGVAFANGRVYRGFRDGHVIAYNAGNGEQVWSAQLKETNGMPATIAASPLVWNRMLFIGHVGRRTSLRLRDYRPGCRHRPRSLDLRRRSRGKCRGRRIVACGSAHGRRIGLDQPHYRPGFRSALCTHRQSGAGLLQRLSSGRESLHGFDCSARRQKRLSAHLVSTGAARYSRLGSGRRPGPHHHKGRSAARDGGREGRIPADSCTRSILPLAKWCGRRP